MQQKVIPDKKDEISSELEPLVINKDNFEFRKKTNKFSEIAKSAGINIEEEIIDKESKNKTSRISRNKQSKYSVSQFITDNDYPVYLANVEIYDTNNKLLNQTRTNTKGKWLMALSPGDYKVHISKSFSKESGKNLIDQIYT